LCENIVNVAKHRLVSVFCGDRKSRDATIISNLVAGSISNFTLLAVLFMHRLLSPQPPASPEIPPGVENIVAFLAVQIHGRDQGL